MIYINFFLLGAPFDKLRDRTCFLTFWNKAVPEPVVLAVPEPVEGPHLK